MEEKNEEQPNLQRNYKVDDLGMIYIGQVNTKVLSDNLDGLEKAIAKAAESISPGHFEIIPTDYDGKRLTISAPQRQWLAATIPKLAEINCVDKYEYPSLLYEFDKDGDAAIDIELPSRKVTFHTGNCVEFKNKKAIDIIYDHLEPFLEKGIKEE